MNKKLLICGLIATGLALTACVKKETPQEDEQTQVDSEQQSSSEPVELKPLEPAAASAPEAPVKVAIIREESSNTTTEVRREVQEPVKTEAPKVETAPQQNTTVTKSNTEAQTEDDAVAAAIAAATPALEK